MASIHQKDQVTWNTVTFPSFRDGNVSILLENPAVLKIQLHRAVLSKHSKWFEAMFEEIDEKRLQGPEQQQPQYEFALTRATKESPLSLILVANNEPDLSMTDEPVIVNSAGESFVKIEEDHVKPDIAKLDEEAFYLKQVVVLNGYSNFFNAMYSTPPKLDTTSIAATLDQCEALVGVATYLGGLPVIRIVVSNCLTELRHGLYTAIAEDPVRWLNLAVPLKSKAIFGEALIHCAGGFPGIEWRTPFGAMTIEARQVTYDKAAALESWTNRAEMQLLKMNLCDRTTGKLVSPEFGAGSWIVVSIFRHWYLDQKQELDKRIPQCQYAELIRLVYKGGDGYLKVGEVNKLVAEILGPKAGFAPEDSLKKLKKWAKDAIAGLAKNNLMIDPEIAGIPYLTCIEVGDDDYPWEQD